jgi:disulfide bond formation protein DsbB
MSMAANRDEMLAARLNDVALLAMMLVIAAILTTAMVLQYAYGELPCPLCLLQRAALFGVCFGIILHFRYGASARHTGVSLLFALLLLIVSVRQTLLDIYPRPGHSYIGTAVFGLHMPVWSVLIALAILLAFAVKLTLLGSQPAGKPATGTTGKLASVASLYVIALCAINFVSVILQCGFGECHTFGYKLL